LQKSSSGVVQFDIMKNQVLAAGDEHVIKIWDMDKVELFTTIDAEGGLPVSSLVLFWCYNFTMAIIMQVKV